MNVDQFVWWHLFSDGDQATSFPESDLLEATASLVFQGKTSLFYTFQGAVSNKTVTEYTRWIPPGSPAEDRLRTRQVIYCQRRLKKLQTWRVKMLHPAEVTSL